MVLHLAAPIAVRILAHEVLIKTPSKSCQRYSSPIWGASRWSGDLQTVMMFHTSHWVRLLRWSKRRLKLLRRRYPCVANRSSLMSTASSCGSPSSCVSGARPVPWTRYLQLEGWDNRRVDHRGECFSRTELIFNRLVIFILFGNPKCYDAVIHACSMDSAWVDIRQSSSEHLKRIIKTWKKETTKYLVFPSPYFLARTKAPGIAFHPRD